MFPGIKDPVFLRRVAFGILFVVLHYFIVRNVLLLSRDLLTGDFSTAAVRPAPQFTLNRIPNTELVKKTGAHDRLAEDFAQVYFPSRMFDELQKNYVSGDYDPWGRSSRYAPFVHYLCALSYCRLQYGPASLVHLYLQLLLFYISFIAAFLLLKIPRYLPFGILLINICLFLTPAGLGWFERGQFSLYVGMSYLFVTLGILKRKPMFFLLGGLFAFIKWTSFPVFLVLLSVFIFAAGDLKKIKANLLLALPFVAAILVLLVWFPKEAFSFILGLYQQETQAVPEGISLARVLPGIFVKLMPLALILVGAFYFRRFTDHPEGILPFLGGTCVIMLMYPTIAYEYSICSLCFFLPFLLYWTEWASNKGWSGAHVLKYVFSFFLVIASCAVFLSTATGNEFWVFWVYAVMAAALFLAPLLMSRLSVKNLPPLRTTS